MKNSVEKSVSVIGTQCARLLQLLLLLVFPPLPFFTPLHVELNIPIILNEYLPSVKCRHRHLIAILSFVLFFFCRFSFGANFGSFDIMIVRCEMRNGAGKNW